MPREKESDDVFEEFQTPDRSGEPSTRPREWPAPPPDVAHEEIERIHKIIEEDSTQVEPSCYERSLTALIVETTADEPCPVDFLGDTADIVYFISMAHTERYGADHPLAKAAAILKRELRVNMAPLLKFADARPDNAAEEQMLESLWQEAAPLAQAARNVAEAIQGTPVLSELTSAFPELPERLRELSDIAAWAHEHGARVRLTYVI